VAGFLRDCHQVTENGRIYIEACASVSEARRGIGGWLNFYNGEHLHHSLGCRTPCEMFQAPPITCGDVDNASALTTSPQAHHQQQEGDSIEMEKTL
jgi:hypothetical protein